MKKIYQNKKTNQIVITGETLDRKNWKLLRKTEEIKKRDTSMKKNQVIKK